MVRPSELELAKRLRRVTGARDVELTEHIQSLWGGYGELHRARLSGTGIESVVVKCVEPPARREFARDAAQLRSHRRKVRSYAVELAFYQRFSAACDAACRVPTLLYGEAEDERFLFLLEDLDRAGFPVRKTYCTGPEISVCLKWLAAFHARFLGIAPAGLWNVGTYWHLATRPDELARLNAELRRSAAIIDQRLNSARFQSLVHGDAKLENFCFSADSERVAAVDFQYVGGGIGVKDVAYFLSGCLSVKECAVRVPGYLDEYFRALRSALNATKQLPHDEVDALEREWRALFAWAWSDFHRFLRGWAPAAAESDAYGKRQLESVLSSLG